MKAQKKKSSRCLACLKRRLIKAESLCRWCYDLLQKSKRSFDITLFYFQNDELRNIPQDEQVTLFHDLGVIVWAHTPNRSIIDLLIAIQRRLQKSLAVTKKRKAKEYLTHIQGNDFLFKKENSHLV